jgi:hypothetical protein
MDITGTKRKNIQHFDEMSNKDFHLIMDEILDYGSIKLEANHKLDGFFSSAGRDFDGRIWMASGKSGKIYDGKDFVRFAQAKHKEKNTPQSALSVDRSIRYRNLLELFQKEDPEWLKPGDWFTGEWFDTMGVTQSFGSYGPHTVQFVNLKYHYAKFADRLTVYVYETNNPRIVGQEFGKGWSNKVEFRSPVLFYKNYFEIDPNIFETYEHYQDTLRKSKPAYWDSWILQQMKRCIGEQLLADIERIYDLTNILGATEGVVIKTITGKKYKLITPEFRKLVKKS